MTTSLPAGVDTVTVTSGQGLSLPDGTPYQGRLIFMGPELASIAGEDVVVGGSVEVPLVDGHFSVTLVATDADGLDPTGGTYQVIGMFTNAPSWTRYVLLPKATPEVALADILVLDPVQAAYSVLVRAAELLARAENLADLPDPAQARVNLGLGGAATRNVGTTAGTVAAGDDPRMVANADALSKTQNLADLGNAATARTNLGLGSAAVQAAAAFDAAGAAAAVAAAIPSAGTGAGTYAAGNDSRITGAAQKAQNLADLSNAATARTNLGLGSAAVQAAAAFDVAGSAAAVAAAIPSAGTGAGTYAAGDDSRIVGAAQKSQNLADLVNAATARTNLGLGGSSVLNVGTAANTVAAGDDSRFSQITSAVLKSQNLSDLPDKALSRTNLGLGNAAVLNVGALAGTVAAGDDSRISGAAQKSQNLADLGNAASARGNLGLGGSSLLNVGTATNTVAAGDDSRITGAAQKAQNLSDLVDKPTARANLGLGAAAVAAIGSAAGTVAAGNDSRLSDSRTPLAHAASHGSGGSDPLTPANIGAYTAGAGTALESRTTVLEQTERNLPSDQNLLDWSYDPDMAGHVTAQSSGGVAGRITLTRMTFRKAYTISTIWVGVSGVDAAATLSNCYLGIYDAAGNLKGVTADLSSQLVIAGNAKAMGFALTSSFTVTPGYHYMAMLLNGTWTTNSFTFKASGAGVSVNAALAAPNLRYANMLTAQTSLPGTLNMASQTSTIITTGWGSQWYGVA